MEPKTNAIPLFDGTLTCSSAIGLFLLNFGHLEFKVLVYLQKRLPAGEFEKVRAKPFKDRVARAGELFSHTPERCEAYAGFLRSLTPIRELRNHLAHGFLQILVRPRTTEPVIGITRAVDFDASFAAETRHLTLNDLTQQVSALGETIEQFARLTDHDSGWSASSLA
jgi:hypothetical protein